MAFSATLPNQVVHLTQSQSQSDGRHAGHFLSPFMSMGYSRKTQNRWVWGYIYLSEKKPLDFLDLSLYS